MLFTFDTSAYQEKFATDGYVHIKNGVAPGFLCTVMAQSGKHMQRHAEFAVGDKQQAIYEFPQDEDYVAELKRTVASVCCLQTQELVLSERHIKGYEPDANPRPPAHKDRFASEISVGISVDIREGSTLVLYPYDLTDTNPFNASTLLRASLSPDRLPEPLLQTARRVEIRDSAGDVIIFRGNRFWHLRENPANTTVLYLKLNTLNCDPLGEDPATCSIRERTETALAGPDGALLDLVPLVGRRVDYVHRMYNRHWNEVLGVVLWGEKHFTIDDQEFALLKAADGKTDLRAIIGAVEGDNDQCRIVEKVRRIARRGVIDLLDVRSTHRGNAR